MAHKGIISRWTAKGFGFITVEGQGKDVFVHQSALDVDKIDDVPPVGLCVEFDIEEDERTGKEKAVRVTAPEGLKINESAGRAAGAGRGPGRPARQTGATKGKVSKWFEGSGLAPGGYGFVVPSSGEHEGKDIYIHHTSFGGGSLNIGWDIFFDVEEDPGKNGKLRATRAGGPAVTGRGCRSQAAFATRSTPYHSGGGQVQSIGAPEGSWKAAQKPVESIVTETAAAPEAAEGVEGASK